MRHTASHAELSTHRYCLLSSVNKKHLSLTTTLAALVVAGVAFWKLAPHPLFDEPESAILLARDGSLLSARIADDGQWRFPDSEQVPDKFRIALLAYEDKRFEHHIGIDPLAVMRAARANWRNRRVVSGASTITMQLARLIRTQHAHNTDEAAKYERTFSAKLLEGLLALRLEVGYSKQQILNLYASHAPFGGNVVGFEAAAWRYYGRSSTSLSWSEACTLAVLPNSPALVTPGKNRERLRAKRDRLLQRLHDNQTLSDLDLQLALAEPLVGQPLPLPDAAPHLLETLRTRYPDRHRFRSTLDASLQYAANNIVAAQAQQLAQRQINNAAALVVDNESFEVLAYVGNASWSVRNDQSFAVDIVQRPRSTGSILKPFLYAAMLDSGQLLPRMLIPDIPTQYSGFTPENFDKTYRGAAPADVALAQSLNIPAVRLLKEYSVERFYDLLQHLGMSTLTRPPDDYGLTLILGGAEGTLWDITRMHANLAYLARQPAQANYQPLHWLVNEASTKQASSKAEISTGAAWLTLNALLEVPRPAEEGYWRSFASSRKIAWKTGTSWGLRDGWAIGSSGRYTVGVWAGNANGQGVPGLTGSSAAAPILFELHNRLPAAAWFVPPFAAMRRVEVCHNDGYLANDYCEHDWQLIPAGSHFDQQSTFNQLVHLDSGSHYRVDSQCERVANMQHVNWFVLPPAQEFYYRRSNANYRELPPYRRDCSATQSARSTRALMEFLYPNADTKLYIPLDLDGKKGRAVFEAVHRDRDAVLYWHLDDEYLGSTQTFHQLSLDIRAGPHVITIVDKRGNRLSREFEVLERTAH